MKEIDSAANSGPQDRTNPRAGSHMLCQPGIRVAPSLLAADFSRLADEIRAVEGAGAEILHLDVMDGRFVPNISFGAPVIEPLRRRSGMLFDAHLMIDEPDRYAESFVRAGCDHVTFQIEAMVSHASAASVKRGRSLAPEQFREAGERAVALLDRLHALGVTAGVCLNPDTPARAVRPVLDRVEMVLVMSVWPGFGGQTLIRDVLPKVTELRSALAAHQRLEIDGGIGPGTVGMAVRAGADTLVAGSAVFGVSDPAVPYRELSRLARAAAETGSASP